MILCFEWVFGPFVAVKTTKPLGPEYAYMPSTCGQITVNVPAEFRSNLVFVESCSLNTTEATPGSSMSIDARIVNNNDEFQAQATVEVTADGEVMGTRTLTLDAGEDRDIIISGTAPQAERTYGVTTSVVSASNAGEVSGQSFRAESGNTPTSGSAGGRRSRAGEGRDRDRQPAVFGGL